MAEVMPEEQHKELRRVCRNLRRLVGLDSRVFQALYSVAAVAVLAIAFLSWDSVPTSHLGASQRYFDTRDVVTSSLNEYFASGVPTYTPKDKARLARWNNTRALTSCAAVPDAALVWILKTPKAASSTLQDLIIELQKSRKTSGGDTASGEGGLYVVNTRQLRMDWTDYEAVEAALVASFAKLKRRTVFSAHGWYLNFQKWGQPRPVYVGTIRDPIVRLISHYNYIHFGPRSQWSVLRHGQDAAAPPFEQCIEGFLEDNADRPRSKVEMDTTAFCMKWANIQLKYFCGYEQTCKDLPDGGAEAYAIAKRNLDVNFLVVVVVEKFDVSLRVLEALLPSFFSGIKALYDVQGSSRVNTKSTTSKVSAESAEAVAGTRRRLEVPSTGKSSEEERRQWRTSRPSASKVKHRALLEAARDGAGGMNSTVKEKTEVASPAVMAYLEGALGYEIKLYQHASQRLDAQSLACTRRALASRPRVSWASAGWGDESAIGRPGVRGGR